VRNLLANKSVYYTVCFFVF